MFVRSGDCMQWWSGFFDCLRSELKEMASLLAAEKRANKGLLEQLQERDHEVDREKVRMPIFELGALAMSAATPKHQ